MTVKYILLAVLCACGMATFLYVIDERRTDDTAKRYFNFKPLPENNPGYVFTHGKKDGRRHAN